MKTSIIHSLATIATFVLASVASAGTPVVDGTLDAAAGYSALSTTSPATKTGFSAAIDASALYYTSDASNLYFFIQGNIRPDSTDGIMFLLGTTAQTGATAGTNLGGIATSGQAFQPFTFGANAFKAGFEVDRGYVGGSGATPTDFNINTANYVGAVTGGFLGNAGQSGATVNDSETTQAFKSGGVSTGLGSSTGWEIAIKRSALGNVSSANTLQALAIVVSFDGFFSDDSAPAVFTGNGGHGFNLGSVPNAFVGPVQAPVSVSGVDID